MERACLRRYLDLLQETFGASLVEVSVFGSVARGESWPPGMPIRSDLDLLVVTDVPVADEIENELIDATMPLFLESGRVIGPTFKTLDDLRAPSSARMHAFLEDLRRHAIAIYRRESS